MVYAAGGYGTFLEWVINFCMGNVGFDLPFDSTGSAHKYVGKKISETSEPEYPNLIWYKEYFTSGTHTDAVVRGHPYISPPNAYVARFSLLSKHIVYIQPDTSTKFLVLMNSITKVLPQFKEQREKSICNIPCSTVAERRSHIANWLVSYTHQYIEQQFGAALNEDVVVVKISDLIHDFGNQVRALSHKLGINISRDRDIFLDTIGESWLACQKYKDIDDLCNQIIEKTINDHHFDWSDRNFSIYEEAMVQFLLKEKYNKNLLPVEMFPTNTSDLRQIILLD